ncbi:MAG: hypothetical protein M1829_000121 [Trizodia sp. TS-e1964]|nr:MAG: hypothetical protein M1829_000121 [Trizodia sp. TS-e1964]
MGFSILSTQSLDLPILSINDPAMIAAMAVILCTIYIIRKDYAAFLNLGPGGTPSTFPGYLRITVLRLFALKNPHLPAPVPASLRPESGYLATKKALVPKRYGIRPKVAGIAPHRQVSQRGTPHTFNSLSLRIQELALQHHDFLRRGTSCFEKIGTGLFAISEVNRTCNGEICHVHGSDGSLHLTLHPADAEIALNAGWGERHPLAKGGWLTRFVPMGFVMIYAPRDESEVEVVMEIIKAATWWVSGRSLDRVSATTAVEPSNADGLCVLSNWEIAGLGGEHSG